MKPRKKKARKVVRRKAARGNKGVTIHTAADARWPAGVGTMFRPIKKPVTLRLDADVIAWFQAQGRGYQTRINKALREVMTLGRRRQIRKG